MRSFIGYLRDYYRNLSVKPFLFTFFFVAVLVVVNYTTGIERRIRDIHPWYKAYGLFFVFYCFVFLASWSFQYAGGRGNVGKGAFARELSGRRWWWLLLVGPAYFAAKMTHWDISSLLSWGVSAGWRHYWQMVLQLPAKLLLLLMILWGIWKWEIQDAGPRQNWLAYHGLTRQAFRAGPYLLILLMMAPLVALASTRADFLHTYPKFRNIAFIGDYTRPVWPWQLLYELSYGLDFLNIELFFRGLLAIGLARYAGDKAILPMAAFYCTIHFGKPMGECISSFFGGMVLGVLSVRSRSILGGLMVHLGLAWMMELGGWMGNLLR